MANCSPTTSSLAPTHYTSWDDMTSPWLKFLSYHGLRFSRQNLQHWFHYTGPLQQAQRGECRSVQLSLGTAHRPALDLCLPRHPTKSQSTNFCDDRRRLPRLASPTRDLFRRFHKSAPMSLGPVTPSWFLCPPSTAHRSISPSHYPCRIKYHIGALRAVSLGSHSHY